MITKKIFLDQPKNWLLFWWKSIPFCQSLNIHAGCTGQKTNRKSLLLPLRGSRHLFPLLLERQRSALECLTYPECSLATVPSSSESGEWLLLISPNLIVTHCGYWTVQRGRSNSVRVLQHVDNNSTTLLCHDHTHHYALKMEREPLGRSFLPSVTSQTRLWELAEVGDQSGFTRVTPFSFQPVILVMFRALSPNFPPREC